MLFSGFKIKPLALSAGTICSCPLEQLNPIILHLMFLPNTLVRTDCSDFSQLAAFFRFYGFPCLQISIYNDPQNRRL